MAKQKRAQAQKRIHETMAGLSNRSAFETFDRMAEKIEENERVALASAEVTEALSAGDTLEQEFTRLGAGSNASVEARLLQLKQSMGVQLPAGAAPKALGAGNGETAPKQSVPASSGKQLGSGSMQEDGPVHDAELEEEA